MKYLLLFSLLFSLNTVFSQEQISREDYKRAVSFLHHNFNSKVYNLRIGPNWFEDESGLWFKSESAAETSYRKLMFKSGDISDLFDHNEVARLMTSVLDEPVDENNLKFDDIQYINSKKMVLVIGESKYLLDLKKKTLILQEKEKAAIPNHQSPDGKWEAYTEGYNLFVRNIESGETKQLSSDGAKDYAYGSWYGWADIMEGENADRPEHFRVNWSPNSDWLQLNICDTRTAEKMYLLDWSLDSLYRPKLLSYYRGSPGDTTMVYEHTVFLNVLTGKRVEPKLPKVTHINPLEVTWSSSQDKAYIYYTSRGYQSVELLELNLDTEEQTRIYYEESETNIDNFDYEFLEHLNRVYFFSERDGWKQGYYVELDTKKLVNLTNGAYYVNELMHFDGDYFYFMASGVDPDVNPYFQKLYKINKDGGELIELTSENLHHDVRMSVSGRYACDNISSVDTPTHTVVRDLKIGKVIAEIGRADVSDLKGYRVPKVFTAIGRDDSTTIYGAMWLPSNFDPSNKYPVIDASYTGPHTNEFPVEFRRSIYDHALAELGFIVVRIDGLGSSGRSKEFHDYSYGNLGGNLEDHILAIRQLSEDHPWIDTTRVGIYGHSAGGYDAAHALLAYPDFYKVGVASSGDHDHRMEKAWWPEMYMGWPVDSAYHLQSNVTMAGNLKGKLLIAHGGIDENVNPSASFKLAEALIRADKQFDLLILPSQSHGYTGEFYKYFMKTRWNYFVKHLLGVEPIWDIEWQID